MTNKVAVLVQEQKTIVLVHLVHSLKNKTNKTKRIPYVLGMHALILLITTGYAQYTIRSAELRNHLNVGCFHQFFYSIF